MQGITNGLSASIHYNPRGQWVSGNNYSIDDWLYDDKGQYICIAPVSASTTAPSQDTTHFTKTEDLSAFFKASQVKQAKGQSTTDVMSQKSVTDLLDTADLTATNTSLLRTTGGSLAIKDGQELVTKVEGVSQVVEVNGANVIVSSNNEYKNVGRNLWDEEWEVGSIDSIGQNTSSTTNIRSKNYIQVIGGLTYYLKSSTGNVYNPIFYYDSNKNFISSNTTFVWNNTLTIPSNVAFIRFYQHNSYGRTYNHDICINKSDASFNGTYEPYQSNLLSYNGTLEHKVGVVDLGSLTWARYTDATNPFFYANINDMTNATPNFISEQYSIDTTHHYQFAQMGVNGVNKTLYTAYSQNRILIRDDDYTTAPTFKASLVGKKIIYELATPTTEQIVNATNVELKGVGTAKDTLYNESGLASWNNGLTEQVNKNGIVAIPYSVSEEFAVSINGQLQHNLEVDKSQQEEIQNVEKRVDVVETELDKKYELIEDITLSEDTNIISRTTTPNGTPYKFKKVFIIYKSAVAVGGNKYIDYYLPDNQYARNQGGFSADSQYCTSWASIEGKLLTTHATTNNDIGGRYVYQGGVIYTDYTYMNKIDLELGAKTGSNIKIYGIWAD